MTRRRNAFTIVELMVVITIIATLLTLLLPAVSQAKKLGISTQCLTNARSIAMANLNYAADSNQRLPTTRNYSAVYNGINGMAPMAYWFEPEYSNVAVTVQGTGLLYQQGYIPNWTTFYCPGRNSSADACSRYYPSNISCWKTFPAGGWIRNSYCVASSNLYCDGFGALICDIGKFHRADITDPGKIMAFDLAWSEVASGGPNGLTKNQHGMGYNYSFFDGSGRFVPDHNNYLETHFDIGYVGMGYNVGYNDANLSQIMYYMMTVQMGWSDTKYRQYMPH